jgi:hypothetical protein
MNNVSYLLGFMEVCYEISGHLRDDLAKGTLNSILKQSGLKEEKEDD